MSTNQSNNISPIGEFKRVDGKVSGRFSEKIWMVDNVLYIDCHPDIIKSLPRAEFRFIGSTRPEIAKEWESFLQSYRPMRPAIIEPDVAYIERDELHICAYGSILSAIHPSDFFKLEAKDGTRYCIGFGYRGPEYYQRSIRVIIMCLDNPKY